MFWAFRGFCRGLALTRRTIVTPRPAYITQEQAPQSLRKRMPSYSPNSGFHNPTAGSDIVINTHDQHPQSGFIVSERDFCFEAHPTQPAFHIARAVRVAEDDIDTQWSEGSRTIPQLPLRSRPVRCCVPPQPRVIPACSRLMVSLSQTS